MFVPSDDGTVSFAATPAPSDAEIAQIAWTTCRRVVAYLRKQGRFVDGDSGDTTIAEEFAANEPALAACYAGSIMGTITLGANAGRRVVRLFGQAAGSHTRQAKPAHGFDVHAATRVSANDKAGRERLCRYLLRPPISHERLKLLPDGRVQLKLKRVWSDGTSEMVFEPLDFIGKLAALVPPPRAHLVKYSGAFAPNHKLRKLVVPKPVEQSAPRSCEPHANAVAPVTAQQVARRMSWAQLMKRVFEVDVLVCPRCKTEGMQTVATIVRVDVITKILRSVGLSTEAPKLAPARRSAQTEFDF